MKISDLKQINLLVQIKNNCDAAIQGITAHNAKARAEPGNSGLENYRHGYNAWYSEYKDGSGLGSDMSGCYVGAEASEALIVVLQNQIIRVCADLEELGVEF